MKYEESPDLELKERINVDFKKEIITEMLANTSLSRFWPHTLAARVQGFSAAYKNTAYCPVRRCFV